MGEPNTRADGRATGQAGPPLPEIPFFATGTAGPAPLATLESGRLADLADQARRHYGAAALKVGDRLSREWLRRCSSPYAAEVLDLDRRLGVLGFPLLNLSFEWTCTAAVAAPGAAPLLVRTLDWPLAGLGRNLVVAEHAAPVGTYVNITWPGFLGVATALAPGRFAAAINQPPMTAISGAMPLDWLLMRLRLSARRAMPPMHLLRLAFERCPTYTEAKALLTRLPLCLPAFFTLAGTAPGEGCVIERDETAARVHELPAAIANHWLDGRPGRPRGADSRTRHAAMCAHLGAPGILAEEDLGWAAAPIVNPTTRLAAMLVPATGRMAVRGFEAAGPATAIFAR